MRTNISTKAPHFVIPRLTRNLFTKADFTREIAGQARNDETKPALNLIQGDFRYLAHDHKKSGYAALRGLGGSAPIGRRKLRKQFPSK